MRQYQLEGQMSLFDFMTDSSDRVEEKQWTGFITFTFEPDREEEPEEIPVWHNIKQEPHQYKITDDMLGWGTKREKYRANVNAIRVLKQCEKQSRLATLEEQEILAKYVGWGGLSEVFSNHSQWKQEYIEIKEILTDTEYGSAKRSTLTAFYTPPIVIRAIYKVLVRMGLKNGNILEPSCGIGNFIGLLPHDLEKCKVYGVELDSISGRIAKQLYQKSDITVCGFENADYPDNFFDAVVGNIPFGQIKIKDARYDKMNLSIHDYFIVKALDKVRPGGVIVLLTSSWTMDKEKPFVRKYIAERAELIGAVRLPNNTFQKNAGTDITADILFFQKRDHVVYEDPKWLVLGEDANGILQNRYFIDHPEMILGTMAVRSTQYGEKSICKPSKEDDLEKLLDGALSNIKGKIREYESRAQSENGDDGVIPADPKVKNYSFTLFDNRIYYRENSIMRPIKTSMMSERRIKSMIAIRDCVKDLIRLQNEECDDSEFEPQLRKLNGLYDSFRRKYGLLNSHGNRIFSKDNSYPLLCSLEILDSDGKLLRKSDMFTKRTIKPKRSVTKAETSVEALAYSVSEKAEVDMSYMMNLTGKNRDEIEQDLRGVIFRLPGSQEEEPKYVTADEYLSGNVRHKLKVAKKAAEKSSLYKANVIALEQAQPKELEPSEISVRLGTTWIPVSDIRDFIVELLDMDESKEEKHQIGFTKYTGWVINHKRSAEGVLATETYGTTRKNAFEIMEDTLNLKEVIVYDTLEQNGTQRRVVNQKETAAAQGKQDMIKQKFADWIWRDDERRDRLVALYNERFNDSRPREYDGSHLSLNGISPSIVLKPHQKNGIARIIYGGNTLLAHVVGAGKTFTMVAAAMELKRLGLCNKSMIVVPNHIVEQFASEWMTLYPTANILVTTKKDFKKENRRKFCARIATSDIDAVIIGQSQFFKIPVSEERYRKNLWEEIDKVDEAISESEDITVKQLEQIKANLLARLEKLNNQQYKDDMLCFEDMGIDRLFVDEADTYKNLYVFTRMSNVGGIPQVEAQKSSDLYMKCRYMDEITGGKGVIFATGTPISNSMIEMYTMQKYLQYDLLEEKNLEEFDSWASTFGETVSAIEIAPEGKGYRLKTRFAKFYNLPELMSMFREVADIQTADMLDLPVPEAEYRVIKVMPSEIQKQMVELLAERADRLRNHASSAKDDNMLCITNDGRKLALDQRIMNPMLPDYEGSKVNVCADEIYRYWKEGMEDRHTQIVFCDLSTPKKDGSFNVYDDLRKKLVAKGIPNEKIAYIHEAETDQKKKELFAKVRQGVVRVLIGSTEKMGAGTNVQDRIIASHDLDVPWRPRDLEQRAGRTIRQGNRNKKVSIIRYVVEGTFDAYMYQLLENKQKFIAQIMTSKSPVRTAEDIDETALSYAEIKALASGNPLIKEKMQLDIEVSKLQLQKQSYLDQIYRLKNNISKRFPNRVKYLSNAIQVINDELQRIKDCTPEAFYREKEFPGMKIGNFVYTDLKEAGKALIEACSPAAKTMDLIVIGEYRGLTLKARFDMFKDQYVLEIGYGLSIIVGLSEQGNIIKINKAIAGYGDMIPSYQKEIEDIKHQIEVAKLEVSKAFPYQKELEEKSKRLAEINSMLELDEKSHVIIDEAA